MTNFKSARLPSLLIALVIMLAFRPLVGQDRCGTVEVMEKKRSRLILQESDAQFEQWMNQRAALRKGRGQRTGAYMVPVVFHIIHKGESVGSGANVSDAQLVSQVAVLNRDFNRTNRDASSTPAEFAAVAGSIDIAFVLAKQDPDGNPTSGIVRVKGTRSQWSTDDESILKALSYWPAEDYLNIWVTDLSSSLLGYAQFPVSDLAGLETAEDNRLTDGVVVDYSVVGSSEDGTFNLSTNFNKGRSATHEVGHFFGLRHIWGDDSGSCAGMGDYVVDTPNQGNNTDGCPTQPQTSCSVHTMFQNYMDYTNDVCMNLFTLGQVARMATVIENSPRRASLLISTGAEDPAPVANDVALVSFASPAAVLCEALIRPVLSVENRGTQNVTRLAIAFSSDSDTLVTTTVLAQPLQPGANATVMLDAFELHPGASDYRAAVITVNGTTDGKSHDNSITGETYLYARASLPYKSGFDATPGDWRLTDTNPMWNTKIVDGNGSLFLNAFGTSGVDSASAITPLFDVPAGRVSMIFDVAYAQRSTHDLTRLAVYSLDACSDDVTSGTLLYSKTGAELATATGTSSEFVPGALSWRQEIVDLSAIAGAESVRFAVVASGSGGNNLYLDNFQIVGDVHEDVELVDVTNFSPVSCHLATTAELTLLNHSSTHLNSVQVSYAVNGEVINILTFDNLALSPGARTTLPVSDIPTLPATNLIAFNLVRPNGLFDVHDADNSYRVSAVVSGDSDIIPNRQTFENGPGSWTSISPYGGPVWSLSATDLGSSMVVQESDGGYTQSAWLTSPVLDFSGATVASMFFEVSRLPSTPGGLPGSRADSNDTLSILTSADCGASYTQLVAIPLPYSDEHAITPAAGTHWTRRFVNLTRLAGESSVRVAFVLNNPKASVYLDNVEFFVSADSTPVTTDQPFTVYGTDPSTPNDFYITFHLADRQEVSYALLDITGRSLLTTRLTDVLNQTYQVQPPVSAGIYLLRVQIGSDVYTSRVFIDR
ncbi:MAG TPA: M43 family zinc metalloprotease [Chryseolinea sp.]|nr:M43 family zinc metalloprotease [Chryseolinea sp.]